MCTIVLRLIVVYSPVAVVSSTITICVVPMALTACIEPPVNAICPRMGLNSGRTKVHQARHSHFGQHLKRKVREFQRKKLTNQADDYKNKRQREDLGRNLTRAFDTVSCNFQTGLPFKLLLNKKFISSFFFFIKGRFIRFMWSAALALFSLFLFPT